MEPGQPTLLDLLAAIAETADLVELCALALPLEVAGPADAAVVLDLWASATTALEALAAQPAPPAAEPDAIGTLRERVARLGPALAALRSVGGP